MKDEFGKYHEATEPGRCERAYAWATAIGLQDVDGLKPSKYLIKTAKRNIEGEISAVEARKLVDAYYENQRLNVAKTRLPLEEFFKVLLFGCELELKNRFLRIGCEDGTSAAKGISGLHRVDVGINDANVGINVGINETEEKVIKLLLRNSKFTAAQLGVQLGVEKRHVERIIASLKKKSGLKRRGARKNGEWYFEEP